MLIYLEVRICLRQFLTLLFAPFDPCLLYPVRNALLVPLENFLAG
jgi:hypothetical protein